ncbi:MAG: ATP synthase F1 subunit epsilon [Alphaproteobacteria bacterium]|tara:strand:- start:1112 stop:1447 length:336 start_codon:yes stop_codon:yes gene_type:complete
MSFNFQIISPQEIILNEDVELVIFPGIEGDFGILKNHMPFLTYLRVGLVYIYHKNNLDKSFLVNGGIVEVLKEKCTLLTEDIVDSKNFKKQDTPDKLDQLKFKIVNKPFYS